MTAEILSALRRGEFATACESARDWSAERPENPQGWHLLGIALLHCGDVEGARAALDRALTLMPGRTMFQLSRAVAGLPAERLADLAKWTPDARVESEHVPTAVAELLLLLAQGRNGDAEKMLKQLQALVPDQPDVKLAEGHVVQLRGQVARAMRCFRAAVESDPANAIAHLSLGFAHLQHGQFALAEESLRTADEISPGNPGVVRALVEACRRQGKRAAAIIYIDRLLAMEEDETLRLLRAQLHALEGHAQAALQDCLDVLDSHPGHEVALQMGVEMLLQLGRTSEAIERVERALSNADSEVAWALRLRLCEDDVGRLEVLERWSTAQPRSVLCLCERARWNERAGDLGQARQLAEAALRLRPGLADAEFLLLRVEVAKDPEAALRRIKRIRPRDDDAAARRSLLAFRGLAQDRLERPADAVADWTRMAMIVSASHPLPMPEPSERAPDGQAEGHLLWAPPGVAIEPMLAELTRLAPERMLAERLHAPQRRDDGFGVRRYLPGHEKAGTAARWRQALQDLGRDPAQAIDWLPHFDAYTASALRGAHTVAFVIDPRDALLNWMAFGSTAGYAFLPDPNQSADWMARCLDALADHLETQPGAVSVLRMDEPLAAADAVSNSLQAVLALPAAPEHSALARAPGLSPALPMRFASGHWRKYRAEMGTAFARLTPVAQRFGYLAE